MVSVSVVVITLNEEKNLERCLRSVDGIADEIVIVDSFSNDKTAEISESFGARFIQNMFQGHIQQKNFALQQAKFPYILSLDADEELSGELRASIIAIKSNWKHDGYTFNRLTSYCGKFIKHGSWYPDRKLRLFDVRRGKWGGVNPHDSMILQNGSTIKQLKGNILHYSFYSIEEHLAKVNNYTSIAAKEAYARGEKSGIFRIIFSPLWAFVRDYIVKKGFLAGYYGFIIYSIVAWEKFLKYVKLNEFYRANGKEGM